MIQGAVTQAAAQPAGLAVCGGYGKLFALYMYMEGIPCQYISGTATDSTGTDSHAWNRVLVDGEWLEVDTTWNDAVRNSFGDNGKRTNDYILLTHEGMAADHACFPFKKTDYLNG